MSNSFIESSSSELKSSGVCSSIPKFSKPFDGSLFTSFTNGKGSGLISLLLSVLFSVLEITSLFCVSKICSLTKFEVDSFVCDSEIISFSTGTGYAISEAKDGTNDFETYDLNFRVNLALPHAYISIGESFSFNDYKHVDTSVTSNMIRSDYTATSDIMLTKAVGDLLPIFDPNKNLFFTLSFEKLISEANIKNYDYIADSFSLSFNKSFKLN